MARLHLHGRSFCVSLAYVISLFPDTTDIWIFSNMFDFCTSKQSPIPSGPPRLFVFCATRGSVPRAAPKDICPQHPSPLDLFRLVCYIFDGSAFCPLTLFTKQTADPPQNAVLLRVVGVVFTGNLKDRRECSRVGIDSVAYSVSNLYDGNYQPLPCVRRIASTCMLVDQDNGNIFTLNEPIEGRLDRRSLRLVVNY